MVARYDQSVSAGNLDIVRRAVQAAIEGNWQSALADLDTGVELDQPRPSGVYRGRAGVQEAMERWSAAWSERHVELEELIDAGDQIVVITHEYARSARTGMPLDRCIAEVWTLRGGKVVAIDTFRDRAAALAAVGAASGKD
jgi:ketosteroid isomerase-like protein